MRKDFISLEEFSSHELTTIIEMIAVMKEAYRKRQVPNF